jgi:hypothetical protein
MYIYPQVISQGDTWRGMLRLRSAQEAAARKFEILNPKSETNSNDQSPK